MIGDSAVSRLWSILFLLVPVLGGGLFVVAAMPDSWPIENHWFPEDISENGYVVDNLFNAILYLTGVIFVATGWALFWFLWKYDGSKNPQPVKFVHGDHTLEIVWSIGPVAVLVFIAVYQMDAWANAKIVRPRLESGAVQPPIAEVTGRQFEWRIRYANTDGIIGTADDVFTVNQLHLPEGEMAVLAIKSQDVLHGFFLPNVRVKQDVVPGMKQFVWFKPLKSGQYDIVCAELCGWGHYKMKGRMTIESRADFDKWLRETKEAQVAATLPASEDEE